MPSNTLTLVAQVDTRQGNQAIAGFNKNLSSIEQAALKGTKGASAAVEGFERTTVKATANIGRQFAGLGGILAGLGIGSVAKAGFDIAASFQTSQVALRAFLGDADKATEMFDRIEAFAAKSPFEFKDLLVGANRLLAFGFEGQQVVPILKAVSAQSSALFGSDQGKFDDFLRALGDVRAAGRLTGEELKQLKNVGVSIDDLGKGFGVSAAEFTEAVSKGIVPAGEAIRVIIDAANKKFGSLQKEVEKTASTVASNVGDALGRLAKAAINLPQIAAGLQSLIDGIDRLAQAAKDNPAIVENIAKAIGILAGVFAASQIISLVTGLATAVKGLSLAMLASPWALAAAGVGIFGVAVYKSTQRINEMGKAVEEAALDDKIRKMASNPKTIADLDFMGITVDRMGQAFGLAAKDVGLLKGVELPIKVAGEAVKATSAEVAKFTTNAAEAAKKVATAEKSAADELDRAKKAELTGLAQILEQHRQYQAELGLSAKANKSLAEAVQIRIRTEAVKELKSNASEVLKNLEDEKKARLDFATAQFKESQDFQQQTLQMQVQNIEERLSAEKIAIETGRDFQLRALDGIGARTVEEKVSIEQQKLAISTGAIQQLEAIDIAALNRRTERAVKELDFLKILYPARIAEIDARIKAVTEAAGGDAAVISAKAAADMQAAQQAASISSAQIVRDNTLRIFDQIKQGSGAVFDAMLTKSGNVFGAMANVLKNALLTAIREVVTSQIARTLTQILTGQGVGLSAGGSGGGKLGGILGTLGIGAAPIFGAGSPGGTGGFAGPVGALSTAAGVGGTSAGLGGGIGGGAGFAGLAGSAGLLGLAGAGLGLKGAFAAGQSSNKFLKGAAPAIGAVSGLLGFGALSFLFPALIAAGPAGWLAAAGIGATIGLIGIFKKKAEDKIVEKVKKVYGIDIDRGFAKDPLLGIIKQNFGGNIDVGLQSPMVRDLIELYAMSFGKSPSGGFTKQMTPLSFSQSGGVLTQMPSYQNGTRLPSIMPSGNQGVVIQNVTLQVGDGSLGNLVDGRQAATLQNNPRLVQSAVATAMSRNIGRRDQQASILAPNLVVA